MVRRIGQAVERQHLSAFVTAGTGASLVLHGDAGTGNSDLLDHAIDLAVRNGHTVVRAIGVEAERELPYAGLHQFLYPLQPYAERLDARDRAVFDAAFGQQVETPPSIMTLGIAVLNLLSATASDRPLLLVLDNGHWFDDASADVCGFVGRRLSGSSVKLLIALRADIGSRFDSSALPELRATGISPPDTLPGPLMLTWQERRIAELAAGGLTNKEIGGLLYLSPRTVSSHLYRIFPKLGITTRAALRDALDGQREATGA
ncbi:AAA family ATPase [Nocardia sp. SYP-A9097]|uniref:helix-turn-helix transcriptional regulator n=1 Tax=Nocardia sp. SYP-A9097 TaxID=2663237 RepID=UPI00281590CE|nr:AAA family ATPase [Nocardia sp. SYP-A9097]